VISGGLSLLAGTRVTWAELYGGAIQWGETIAGVPSLLLLVLWLVLAPAGAVTQFAVTRER